MDKLRYEVERRKDKVFYTIFKGNDEITKREVTWFDLPTLTAVFLCEKDSEKCIALLLEKANKLAKSAICSMDKFEKLETDKGK